MTISERMPLPVDMSRIVELLAKQIYQSPMALLRENCQNAYDAILQRIHLGHEFEPRIDIAITQNEIRISDNGIGMSLQTLKENFWTAGSSGKNTEEARAAGVVGTFGIGAMANFGLADELEVTTESAATGERWKSFALKSQLSANDDCITFDPREPSGKPGTIVVAKASDSIIADINQAVSYITQFVRHLKIPVAVNGTIISNVPFETTIPSPSGEGFESKETATLTSNFVGTVRVVSPKTGEVWVSVTDMTFQGKPVRGELILQQNHREIQAFRSRFVLSSIAVVSRYNFGGIANLSILEPTAGREALTTSSMQLLQSVVTGIEQYVSLKLASTEWIDGNTGFIDWVAAHGRYDLCGGLTIRCEPGGARIRLDEVARQSQSTPMNLYEGNQAATIAHFASEETSLLVLTPRGPRRSCEKNYIANQCKTIPVDDSPQVEKKPKTAWSIEESALAFRITNIVRSDYFVDVTVDFGSISHNLPFLIDQSVSPINIILSPSSGSVATMLQLYNSDFASLTGFAKDFVRSNIFPRISDRVPSSTREGAEAFLKRIRAPRERFELGEDDYGLVSEDLKDIWLEFTAGKLSFEDAAQRSATVARSSVQVLSPNQAASVRSVVPDVIEADQAVKDQSGEDPLVALPAITRPDTESPRKLLTIDDGEPDLNGYRTFLAISERANHERGEFFLQPHKTEIVWGGQKALFIFQHHSGHFALYYELQGMELFAQKSGGGAFPTSTIAIKNQTYIPIPDELRDRFLPTEGVRRFFVRCELLYPEEGVPTADGETV